MAKLKSLFWYRAGSDADQSFVFSFGDPEEKENDGKHWLNARFCDNGGELVEICDMEVSDGQWSALEAEALGLSLPAYAAPEPYLMDATDSRLDIEWYDNGKITKCSYNGESAYGFRRFLETIVNE